jgi:TatD DNase family protein
VSVYLADTHAHLADPALFLDVEEIVATASAVGIERILAVGTDLATSRVCVGLADRFAAVFAAVGNHPHDAATFDEQILDELRALASHQKVVAIGEIGLDYYRENAPRDRQLLAFRRQLELAAELSLPVIVHNREADQDVLEAIAATARPQALAGRAGVLHCFTGSVELADRAKDLGFFVSFAGNLTYKKSSELRAIAAVLALDQILVETDCPYLAPETMRGRTNRPANVRFVVERLAELRERSVSVIAAQTSENARRLFGWG